MPGWVLNTLCSQTLTPQDVRSFITVPIAVRFTEVLLVNQHTHCKQRAAEGHPGLLAHILKLIHDSSGGPASIAIWSRSEMKIKLMMDGHAPVQQEKKRYLAKRLQAQLQLGQGLSSYNPGSMKST